MLFALISVAPSGQAQLAEGGAAGEHSSELVEQARQAFDRGVAAYRDGAFELARAEFKHAYELSPNYRVLYNIGQVNHQLRRHAEALVALEQYLREGGDAISLERREATVQAIHKLRTRTAHLTIRSNVPNARVSVGGKLVGETPLVDVLVDAGQLDVTLRKPGYTDGERSLILAGGDSRTLDILLEELRGPVAHRSEPPPLDAGSKGPPPYLWVGWAASGVLAASALATGASMLSTLGDRNDLEKQPISRQQAEAVEKRGRNLALATDILGAAALAAAGVSLYFTLRSSGKSSAADRPGAKASGVRLGLTPLQGKLELRTEF